MTLSMIPKKDYVLPNGIVYDILKKDYVLSDDLVYDILKIDYVLSEDTICDVNIDKPSALYNFFMCVYESIPW